MEPITNVSEFLTEAKAALAEYSRLNTQANQLRSQRDDAEVRVSSIKQKLDDSIADTYRKRRAEIDKTYDGEITKANEQLRKAQSRREKARNQGIRERIDDETEGLRIENKNIESDIRASFRKDGVPAICGTGFFKALYFPSSLGDVVTIIITFAICFFAIPFGLYKFLYDGNTIALIIIYIVAVLLFGGIYIGISRATVFKHHAVLVAAVRSREQIQTNRRRIAEITRNIQNDTNESLYNLAAFDDEIAHIRQQLADITMKKNDALHTFETVTKNIISDEITNNAKPKLDEAQQKLNELTAQYNEVESARKAKALSLSSDYEVYLGKEFMSRSKIEKLEEIMAHGTATNISEAIEEYYRKNDI